MWDDVYLDEKVSSSEISAKHRTKFCMVEDAINVRWKEVVTWGNMSRLTRAAAPDGIKVV